LQAGCDADPGVISDDDDFAVILTINKFIRDLMVVY